MDAEDIPNVGYLPPSYEQNCLLRLEAMTKKEGKRGKRPPTIAAMRLRRLLADNLRALLNHKYPLARYSGKAEQEQAFAKDAGVSWSTVQRALDPENGQTIDILADLAAGLDMPASALLSRELDLPFRVTDGAEAGRQKAS